jgi:hypothetical protein
LPADELGSQYGGLVDDVHHGLEQRQALGGEPQAAADHHTVISNALQRTFQHDASGCIGRDHAGIALPTPIFDLRDS